MKEKSFLDEFDQELIKIIEDEHSPTLDEAVRLVCLKFHEDKEIIMDRVLCLESEGKISFEKQSAAVSSSLNEYLLSDSARWFWAVFSLAVLASIMVFFVPEDSFPLVYARYLFSSVFVLFLPGYSLIKALFSSKELDNIERLALSVGLSLALVPLVGLLLNYTPWGIRTTPVTLGLLALTLVFASAAVIRDYGQIRRWLMFGIRGRISCIILKKNRFEISLLIVVLLIIIGFGLLLIPNIIIDEYERLLGASDLTLVETWRYEGALQWWRLTSAMVFVPLAVLLIIVNVSILFLIALANRRYQSE